MSASGTSTQSPHVLLAGGGTLGHVFPGLALAEQLVRLVPQIRITFAGTGRQTEQKAIAAAGFGYVAFPCRAMAGPPWSLTAAAVINVAGCLKARAFLRSQEVSLVVGLGGYASVPAGLAAARRGLPLVLVEQNALPGRATRWLAPRAAAICLGFEEARPRLQCAGPVRHTGTPVRAGIAKPPHALAAVLPCNAPHAAAKSDGRAGVEVPGIVGAGRELNLPGSTSGGLAAAPACTAEKQPRRLLILGGSQGAAELNQLVPHALSLIRGPLGGWHVVHQAGNEQADDVAQRYQSFGVSASVVPFVEDMALELSRAELVICRAGGSTLAELAAAGVPAILLPYPRARDQHQLRNAEVFAAAGAARLIDTRQPHDPYTAAERLAHVVQVALEDQTSRREMAYAAALLARPCAAWHVAQIVRGLLS
jgi:UDP-N-acetylglucosamine--N-acetylmuramyl-(pentapeptide) pyrophosphoryl-undecaprenol N-acetylglucosamine transferase